jgi:hypothetical protein
MACLPYEKITLLGSIFGAVTLITVHIDNVHVHFGSREVSTGSPIGGAGYTDYRLALVSQKNAGAYFDTSTVVGGLVSAPTTYDLVSAPTTYDLVSAPTTYDEVFAPTRPVKRDRASKRL